MARIWTSQTVIWPSELDAATTAWIAAVVANGGSVSQSRSVTVNALITGLKADNTWNKLDRLWLLAAANQPSALTDLVATSLATTVNSPTFTADQGYAGNGSTSYIDTNYNPSGGGFNYTQNSANISAWCNTDRAAANLAITGAIGPGNSQTDLWPYTSISVPTGVLVRINNNLSTVAGTSSLGFFTINRSGASSCECYHNGSSLGTTTDASQGISSANFAVLAGLIFGGGLNGPSTDQCCAVAYGSSLTATEAADFYTRFRNYMTAVGVP